MAQIYSCFFVNCILGYIDNTAGGAENLYLVFVTISIWPAFVYKAMGMSGTVKVIGVVGCVMVGYVVSVGVFMAGSFHVNSNPL